MPIKSKDSVKNCINSENVIIENTKVYLTLSQVVLFYFLLS